MTNMRNALKALGAILAVIALCAPLMLLPVEDSPPPALGYTGVTITTPPTVVVATTIPGLEPTTTTTEAPPPPPPEPTSSTTTTTAPTEITIAAAGSTFVPGAMLDSVRGAETGQYDFGPVLAPIVPYLSRADYTVAALGPRLAGSKAGFGDDSVANAPKELALALQKAGIDLVATANPHSLDLGWEGVVGTLDRLDEVGLAHVGSNRSQEERVTPKIVDVLGIKVAFLDYTASVLGKLSSDAGGDFAVNMLDPETVNHDAITARSWGADVVVAMIDYGTGAEPTGANETAPAPARITDPTLEQKVLLGQVLDSGVDAVLGYNGDLTQPIGHTFTYASWRVNDRYVAYSLGDLLSAQDPASPGAGLIAYIHITKNGLRTYITGVSYLPVYIQLSPATEEGPATYRALPVLPGLEPDTDVPLTAEDRQKMAQLWNETRSRLYRPDENISPLAPADLGL